MHVVFQARGPCRPAQLSGRLQQARDEAHEGIFGLPRARRRPFYGASIYWSGWRRAQEAEIASNRTDQTIHQVSFQLLYALQAQGSFGERPQQTLKDILTQDVADVVEG